MKFSISITFDDAQFNFIEQMTSIGERINNGQSSGVIRNFDDDTVGAWSFNDNESINDETQSSVLAVRPR